MTDLRPTIANVLDEIVSLRHELHRRPEVRFEEHWTSDRIALFLDEAGVPYRRGWAGGTGIVAEIGEPTHGVVALRADIDALEIDEQTGLPYASEWPNRMHACGHDGHTAILCGAAKTISAHRHELRGAVRLIFQPAEEIAGGGKRMVEEGTLDGVRAAFALHAWPGLPEGSVGIKPGCAMASADFLRIEVKGKGGHGADPGACIDPVVVAAHIVTALQCIVSREINPWEPGVVTIGRIEAGNASNIIPDSALMEGTLRALTPEQRRRMVEGVERIARDVASAFRAEAALIMSGTGYPALFNDLETSGFARETLCDVLGDACAMEITHPFMTAEDFAFYLERVPGVFLFLGNDPIGAPSPPLHSPRFNFNDNALATGIEAMATLALRHLETHAG